MESGYERVGGNKNGQVLKYYNFLRELEEFGGRLEYAEGIEPVRRLPWKRLQSELKPQAMEPGIQLSVEEQVAEKPAGFFARLRGGRRN